MLFLAVYYHFNTFCLESWQKPFLLLRHNDPTNNWLYFDLTESKENHGNHDYKESSEVSFERYRTEILLL